MSTFCFSRLAKWPMSLNLFCSNNVTFNECFPHLIFLQHQMSFSFAEKDMMPIKLYEKRFFKAQDVFSIKKKLRYDQIMFHHFVYENSPVYGSIGRLFIPQFCWWCHQQNIVFATGMSRVTCFRWLASSVFYRAFTLFCSLFYKFAQNFCDSEKWQIISILWFWKVYRPLNLSTNSSVSSRQAWLRAACQCQLAQQSLQPHYHACTTET